MDKNTRLAHGGKMKPSLLLSGFILVFLISAPLTSSATIEAESQTSASTTTHKPTAKNDKPYSGYSVDGRTSASVLSAKRSHQVAKKDEIGLVVFSGLFAIAVIGFLTRHFFQNK
jgi:hypothetical protein